MGFVNTRVVYNKSVLRRARAAARARRHGYNYYTKRSRVTIIYDKYLHIADIHILNKEIKLE